MAENTAELLGTFNFRVTLRRSPRAESGISETQGAPDASAQGEQLGEGGFQECSGLEISMDVAELEEGGRNDGVIKRVGRGKFQPLILKRGMFVQADRADAAIWDWMLGVLSGRRPVARYDGLVEVLDGRGEAGDRVLATWSFERGLPMKVVGPTLNAKTGEVAIEELHIGHEGLKFVVPGGGS